MKFKNANQRKAVMAKLSQARSMPLDMVKYKNKKEGKYFFDGGSTRFFNSRYSQRAYVRGDKAYFITSERFDYNSPRRYTVRVFDRDTGDVGTVGRFNKLTKYQAEQKLRKILFTPMKVRRRTSKKDVKEAWHIFKIK